MGVCDELPVVSGLWLWLAVRYDPGGGGGFGALRRPAGTATRFNLG